MERAELERIILATGIAERRGDFVYLRDPHWTSVQRKAFAADFRSKIKNQKSKMRTGWLCIPTGGTGGGLKFARHDEYTLTAAVLGFCTHFGLRRVNAVGVLPPQHVSGLMARVRCAATGGRHLDWGWPELAAGRRPVLTGGPWVISLVPTQLQRLLGSRTATAWLRRFEIILLGGGPVWPDLADAAARARLRISLSYGMTETAAMVAALRPDEFLAGGRSCGSGLPHARLRIGRAGVVRVSGGSLFRGYAGGPRCRGDFATGDLGSIDERGRLSIVGRRDEVIITGGKKVHPGEVEAAMRATGLFADVVVVGMPDAEWGEMVVACYPADQTGSKPLPALPDLSPYQRPKRLLALKDWPRNTRGKVNRAGLRAVVSSLLNPGGQRRRQRHAFAQLR